MISKGNTKLGDIPNWSIPAIDTCPGASTLCKELCYADKGFYYMNNVRGSLEGNYDASGKGDWHEKMIADIHKMKAAIFRIHVSGDFYTSNYVLKWQSIVEACPETRFYAYTRSWEFPTIRDELVILAKKPNFQMWWSTDRVMREPPRYPGICIAYLMFNPEDKPEYPVDLIFRNSRYKGWEPAKYVDGVLICPFEQAIEERPEKIDCEHCGVCYALAVPDLVQLQVA